ncbi:hypothetical protein ACFVUS_25620 [Nocardia sp. NPDC058058]|uniref:hypothetical protein n=1 Tax=Nocardia sp. NPDC058058 TaxID=3346317 RepID=UPI0036DC11F8
MVFIQYYFALGEPQDRALQRVQDTTRFFLSCRKILDGCDLLPAIGIVAGGTVDEYEYMNLMAEAVANMSSATEIPHNMITPMLGFDWASAWARSRAPLCPRCAAPHEEFDATTWLCSELEVFETCAECDTTALIGDWDLERSSFARTNCCVALRDWPSLPQVAAEVHAHALQLIGCRARYLHGGL